MVSELLLFGKKKIENPTAYLAEKNLWEIWLFEKFLLIVHYLVLPITQLCLKHPKSTLLWLLKTNLERCN